MFRSQTSDNMDRWKSRGGKSQRREEKKEDQRIWEEKEPSQKTEDADARKGSKIAKHCDFPMICSSGGSKNRLAKAAGAEPSGEMRYEKLHTVVARSTFESQNVQATPCPDHFCDVLRGVAFWSIRSSGLLRWFCVTGAVLGMTWHHFFVWQAQYFRQMEWKKRKTYWYEAVSSALNFPCLKEVSQNCFVFDVLHFENWGSLAELPRFWCCQHRKLRTSCRIASLSSWQLGG